MPKLNQLFKMSMYLFYKRRISDKCGMTCIHATFCRVKSGYNATTVKKK